MKKINTMRCFGIILAVLMAMSTAFATKKKVLYLGNTDATKDTQLTTRLATNYDVTYLAMTATTVAEIAVPSNANYAKNYDVIFVSESVGSSSWPNGLLTLEVPVVNIKFLVAPTAKWGLLETTGSKVDVTTLADAVITMNSDNSDHQLSAGLSGDIKLVADGTVSANNIYLNALLSPVSGIIKIASLKSDPSKVVVFGVEAGTTLNCTNKTYPLTAPAKRVANIGLHVSCLNNLTEPAYKLIEASIEWVTSISTAITDVDQNYLSILRQDNNHFSVELSAFQQVELSVYSTIGKLVNRTILNNNRAIIDLSNQPAGIYIVKLNGKNVSETQKIIVE